MSSEEEVKIAYQLAHRSTLSKPVENLLKLLADENLMDQFMIRFHLDTKKMPLAKITKYQIKEAEKNLTRIRIRIMQRQSHEQLTESSNRFYSLIPHSVTTKDVIDTNIKLAEKCELLNDLANMEFTYKLLHKETGKKVKNSLDTFYKQLNVQIVPVESSSEEYEIIKRYAYNGKVENSFEIEDILRIERDVEQTRYKKYCRDIGNAYLLWHGSRITNLGSILANGLKTVPPGNLATGTTFGKGIYFADVFEKSANFCYAHDSNNTAILLLCVVALGNSQPYYDPENIENLPENMNSVIGVGKIGFDSHIKLDNVTIPSGNLTENTTINSSSTYLNYNEYIVYNDAQVKIKYLVKVKFSGPVPSHTYL